MSLPPPANPDRPDPDRFSPGRFSDDFARTVWPRPADAARARLGLDRWTERAAELDDPALRRFATALPDDPAGRAMLDSVFGNSPFLTESLIAEPALVRDLIERGVEAPFRGLIRQAREELQDEDDPARLMAGLRRTRRRAALLIALADIGAVWPLERVTGALSELAETALRLAVRHLLRRLAATGAVTLADPADPERGSGLIILGMGKLGAKELNYSSDIDLIVLYDEGRVRTARPDGTARMFQRLTRDLVRIMEERTRDGHVFRTDLRLRPDPGATPVAVAVGAAETYYGSMALNWERAAMIKARPVAGDAEAGGDLMRFLRQFVWRSGLDFAAIEDIHRIKQQIHRHRGHGAIAINGHNIKVGRGGIREIEFYAQTQQLIFGGRNPRLRCPGTCDTLAALAEAGHIDPRAAADLTRAYGWLRRVEHRLQMIDDRQTHVLPEPDAALDALGIFLGRDEPGRFRAELRATLDCVELHYARLFEDAPVRSSATAGLVFSGIDLEPETRDALARMGFANPDGVAAAVRAWLFGRYRATRSERAQQLLTDLLPTLLRALAAKPSPDSALFRFDEFLARLPAGVPLFSLFHANPKLLDLVAEIMGTSRRLAEHLAYNPEQFDAVLMPGFFDRLPDAAALAGELDELMATAADYQDVLTIVRRWTNDQRFRAGLHVLLGQRDAADQSSFLSDLAEVALRALQPRVEAEFARRHGGFGGAGLALIAMGKLGGREMTIRSDLDLIMVFETGADEAAAESGSAESGGPKPLPVSTYYARLSQRLISAITAPTREGALYEVDMRLRPSGKSGPLATGLEGFVRYQADSAWTWEHMALTRARAISGPAGLRARVDAAIREVLRRPRDPDPLLRDVAEMRERIAQEHRAATPWDVKYLRGGLVDIEFVAQYLQLRHAADHPAVLRQNTAAALDALAAEGLLDRDAAAALIEALRLWQRVQAYLRLTVDGDFDPEQAPPALRDGLARAAFPDHAETVDFARAEAWAREAAGRAQGWYRAIIEQPAAALGPAAGGDGSGRAG